MGDGRNTWMEKDSQEAKGQKAQCSFSATNWGKESLNKRGETSDLFQKIQGIKEKN